MSTMSQRNRLTDSEAWRVVSRLEVQVEDQDKVVDWQPTPNEDRYLVLTTRRHRNMNATLLQQHLRSATGTTVSVQTIRNRLYGVGVYARRPMVCVRLTSRHRRDRREWATEHVNWRRYEWSNVIFSDESRFSVHPDNRRIFIWRDRCSRNNPAKESYDWNDQRVLQTIEHVWDALGKQIAGSKSKSSSGRVGQNTPTRD
ncbi:transposable element Tcb2 transposase [Trichonephila clavipes]|nr:transposable element Tcb2 transposase [Trichonephila clavipes]